MIDALTDRSIDSDTKLRELARRSFVQEQCTQTEPIEVETEDVVMEETSVRPIVQSMTSQQTVASIGSQTDIISCFKGDSVPMACCKCVQEGELCDAVLVQYFSSLSQQINYNKCCYFPPSIAQILKFQSEDLGAAYRLGEVAHHESVSLIAMAISNSSSPELPGTHWSLMVYNKDTNKYYHLDLIRNSSNVKWARKVAAALHKVWNLSKNYQFEELDCFQQSNSIDCGVHVIHNIELVSQVVSKGGNLASNENLFIQPFVASRIRDKLACPNPISTSQLGCT